MLKTYAVAIAEEGENKISIVSSESPIGALFVALKIEEGRDEFKTIEEIQDMAWDAGLSVSIPLEIREGREC